MADGVRQLNGSSDGAVGPVTSIEGIGTANVVGTP